MSPRHLRRGSLVTRRSIAVAVLAVVLLTAALLEANVARPAIRADRVHGAASSNALSSAWFCPLTRASKAEPDTGLVWVANPEDRTITATATVLTTGGSTAPVDVPLNFAPTSRTTLRPADFVDAPFAGVVIRVDGGGVAVDHSVRDATGEATAPCLTETSDNWHFVSGTTTAGSTLLLGLLNPYADEAVLDVRLSTNEGDANPPDYKGIVVPAHGLTVLNVSEQVRRRDWVVGELIVRRGRLAVDQMQAGIIDNVRALGLTPAAPRLATGWILPGGVVGEGLTDRLSLYNPGEQEAVAQARVIADNVQIEPFELHVPAGQRIAIDLQNEARVPKNVRYSLRVDSLNGVPLVAGRSATAVSPSPWAGGTIQTATSVSARRWMLAGGRVGDPWDELVSVVNSSSVAVDVRFTFVGDGKREAGPSVRIEPGRRSEIHLDELVSSDRSVIVDATGPVVVGRELGGPAGSGLSSSDGIFFAELIPRTSVTENVTENPSIR